MLTRPFAVVVAFLAWSAACATAAEEISTQELLSEMRQPHELARYRFLASGLAHIPKNDVPLAQQFLAFTENEMGLYSEAVRDFPLRSRLPEKLEIPRPPQWRAADAADTIVELASRYRVVMVNEAHHDAHTRGLTLSLLPRLRKLGFTHLAVEALDEQDSGLAGRGYPVHASGSEYLHEPVYGEIVREAIKLGFVVVAYDQSGKGPQEREDLQARNLFKRVLASHPAARLFVHAGYAHIDEAPGRLGKVHPMAERLHELSGLDILTVDQTDIREDVPRSEHEAYLRTLSALRAGEPLVSGPMQRPVDTKEPVNTTYYRLVDLYHPKHPIVLRAVPGGAPWSARPGVYDLNVILPPANETASDYPAHSEITLKFKRRYYAVLPPAAGGNRPDWLSLGGMRHPFPISSSMCKGNFPCLVEAHYASEPDEAIAADRYVFLEKNSSNKLWLRPGSYRLRSLDADGNVLEESTTEVMATALPRPSTAHQDLDASL
jgi:hypothetical protein